MGDCRWPRAIGSAGKFGTFPLPPKSYQFSSPSENQQSSQFKMLQTFLRRLSVFGFGLVLGEGAKCSKLSCRPESSVQGECKFCARSVHHMDNDRGGLVGIFGFPNASPFYYFPFSKNKDFAALHRC